MSHSNGHDGTRTFQRCEVYDTRRDRCRGERGDGDRPQIEGAGRPLSTPGRLLTPEPCGTTGGVWIGAHNPSATLAKVQD